ncbi:hypothetical protein DAPPUDRAFT_343179 [Daphnia pulex]|uniref:Uncharacterized protein n=1 Tax=Daphnia pulex TaxID=6669 RepID=E9I6A3_DAPPU|nr:hypothetical protein DAPPUDRAFT_343179 [Daphnia pulex]|eukprot:EFX60477.1 hypothetical protein DAPPUDRAFT_343179 [Daphnia pulex]
MKHVTKSLLVSLLTAGSALAFGATRPPSGPGGPSYKDKLYEAGRVADALVSEINSEISYIQSGGEGGGPDGDCRFCSDPNDFSENDNVVVQHLLVFADRAQEIARLAREAALQPPGGGPADGACLSSQSYAADAGPLLQAISQAEADLAQLRSFVSSSGGRPTNPGSSNPGNGGSGSGNVCTFCEADDSFEEGDPNAALGILGEVGGDLNQARYYLSRYAQGIEINFSFGFGCSYTGDAAINLASADLTLGFPTNKDPLWRGKVDYTVNNLAKARTKAGCP